MKTEDFARHIPKLFMKLKTFVNIASMFNITLEIKLFLTDMIKIMPDQIIIIIMSDQSTNIFWNLEVLVAIINYH